MFLFINQNESELMFNKIIEETRIVEDEEDKRDLLIGNINF